MHISFSDFDRLAKAFAFMPAQHSLTVDEYPEWANVLFCRRKGHEGVWAFFANGFEILGLRVEASGAIPRQLIYARADLVRAAESMRRAGAEDADCVDLDKGRLSLYRGRAVVHKPKVEILVDVQRLPNLDAIPEQIGRSVTMAPAEIARLQRIAGLWADAGAGGDCLWIRANAGAYAHRTGVYWASPGEIPLPDRVIGFTNFHGFCALDPKRPAEVFTAALPGLEANGTPWVGFVQENAIYFSIRHSEVDLSSFGPDNRERVIIEAKERSTPWFTVAKRADRRAMIREIGALKDSAAVVIKGDRQNGAVLVGAASDSVVLRPSEVFSESVVACRSEDICRSLRQEYSTFGFWPSEGQGGRAGIVFSRQDVPDWGVITTVVPTA